MSRRKRESKCEQEIPSSLWRTKVVHHDCDHVDSRTASNLNLLRHVFGHRHARHIWQRNPSPDLVSNLHVQTLKLFWFFRKTRPTFALPFVLGLFYPHFDGACGSNPGYFFFPDLARPVALVFWFVVFSTAVTSLWRQSASSIPLSIGLVILLPGYSYFRPSSAVLIEFHLTSGI